MYPQMDPLNTPPNYPKESRIPTHAPPTLDNTTTLPVQLKQATNNVLPSMMYTLFNGSYLDVYNRLRDTHNAVHTKHTLWQIGLGAGFGIVGLILVGIVLPLWLYAPISRVTKLKITLILSLLYGTVLVVQILSFDAFNKIGEKRRDLIANLLKEITSKDAATGLIDHRKAAITSVTKMYATYMSVCLRDEVRNRLNNEIAQYLRRQPGFEQNLQNVYAILKFMKEEHVFYTDFELYSFDKALSTKITWVVAAAVVLIVFATQWASQDLIVIAVILVVTLFSILPMCLIGAEKHSFSSQVNSFLQKYEGYEEWPVQGDHALLMDMDVRQLCAKMPFSNTVKPEWLTGVTSTTAVIIMLLSLAALLYMIMGQDPTMAAMYTLIVGACTIIIVPCMLFGTYYFL